MHMVNFAQQGTRQMRMPVVVLSGLLLWASGDSTAQTYPTKPVKIVVPSAPGGGTDIIGRLLAKAFSSALGQNFYVENKPGAGNLIGIEAVAHAPADGYTLLFVPSPLVLNPILYKKVNYDPVKDFAPIALAATAPNILVIHPGVKVKNVRDWIDLAKKEPTALNYASAGVGTSPHMSMELFNYMAGIQTLHVPYKGTSPAVTDLLGGQVKGMFSNALTVMPHIQSGKVRPLAVSGAKRLDILPDVPTVMEAGVPNYVSLQWYGLLAPAGTPQAIVQTLNAEMLKALQSKEIKEKLAAEGAEPVGSSPLEFANLIKSDYQKWAGVAKRAGIEPQ
ncbi:tripartite tricarboxylate transporter substrate binding protein [Limnohabitans sp. 15K]|uniref:Bug family tripartite tricarboxylate transporter substrate binding protein n=1 Tax=Limnohabitans sp. 15K TaxID=1100706 RepID=UPI001E3A31DF|nr:tripartite tricarboxylate transporter substrate binding protein [Limnohabitans sp. 15K]